MAATLASMIDRVEVLLVDSTNVIYDTGLITEGIRLAVGEYSLAGELAVTLNGLDGAGATTIPAIHEGLIVVGAAGYTVTARAVDRVDAFSEGGEADKFKAWGDARLQEYRAALGFIFPGYLVVLAGSTGGGDDPALVAAQVALLTAQATLAGAQAGLVGTQQTKAAAEALLVAAQEGKAAAETAAISGKESRAAAAAIQEAADRAAEAARKAELRGSSNAAWGTWTDDE